MDAPDIYCPMVEHPYNECYFLRLDAVTVHLVVEHCAGDHGSCAVLRKKRHTADALEKL